MQEEKLRHCDELKRTIKNLEEKVSICSEKNIHLQSEISTKNKEVKDIKNHNQGLELSEERLTQALRSCEARISAQKADHEATLSHITTQVKKNNIIIQ